VRRSFSHLRDHRIVEILQQKFNKHGSRNDFLQLRRHSVSDGRGVRQLQSGLGESDEIDHRVKFRISPNRYTRRFYICSIDN